MPGLRLSLDERESISLGLARGDSLREIARSIGRDQSTVSREVARNANRRGEYRALGAQRKADERARRPKSRRLDDLTICRRAKKLLGKKYSPMTVSRMLAAEGKGVSHEVIYQEIYRARFGDPRSMLCRPRRSRRRRTRTGRYPDNLGDFKTVHDRAGDVTTEPGHWEGDLLVGADNKTAVVVITERSSRTTLLGALPEGRNADHVADVVIGMIEQIPSQLRRSLTWDQGRELTRWPRIEHTTGVPIYFCDPRSPWQKPLVENQNGLLRRWLPRNQPMPRTRAALDRVAHRLNSIPRRILDWDTATARYHRLADATAS